MHHDGDVQGHLRLQMDRGSPRRLIDGALQELVADQLAQIGALPRCLARKRMHARQRLDAPGESFGKLLRILCAADRLLRDSLYACKRVFDAMIKLANEKLPSIFCLHLRGDVSEIADGAQRAVR